MSSYFTSLTNENVSVLLQQIKQRIYRFKVDWSFEWFEYIKNHPHNAWDYSVMTCNCNVTWELAQAYPHLFKTDICINQSLTWDRIQTLPQFKYQLGSY